MKCSYEFYMIPVLTLFFIWFFSFTPTIVILHRPPTDPHFPTLSHYCYSSHTLLHPTRHSNSIPELLTHTLTLTPTPCTSSTPTPTPHSSSPPTPTHTTTHTPFLNSIPTQAYRLKRTKRDDPMAAFADTEELLEYDINNPRKDLTDDLKGRNNTSVISSRYE